MNLSSVSEKAEKYAREEIEKYNLPSLIHFELSLEKGILLAKNLDADLNIVRIGVSFMDLKLGQAFREGRLTEHVKMSKDAANDFLEKFDLSVKQKETIINCIEAHHGKKEFQSLEAEICANADCYRFLHPKGILMYLVALGKRLGDLTKSLEQVESKMDEKIKIVSLKEVKDELSPFYKTFKEYIKLARYPNLKS